MAHDVFISYSVEDKPTADAVCATLEAEQIRCWIAPRDVLPGMDYAQALVEGIHQSRIMVLIFSSRSNSSPHVMREVERAASRGMPILPLRIEDVPLSPSMEYFISRTHWLDALTPPLERHLHQLTETVRLLLARTESGAQVRAESEAPASAGTAGTAVGGGMAGAPPPGGALEVARRWGDRPMALFALGIVAAVGVTIIVLVALLSGGGGGFPVSTTDEGSPTATVTPTPTPSPTPTPTVMPDGRMFRNVIFSSGVTEGDEPTEVADAFPAGVTKVCAFWDYEGMDDGLTLDVEWFIDGEFSEAGSNMDVTWEGGESGDWWHCIISDSGLPDGLYEVVLSVEGEPLAADAVFVGGDHPLVELSVENLLQETICYVFISPTGAEKWGQDELGLDERILPGDTATFPIPAGIYDLALDNCDQETLVEEYKLDISEATVYQAKE